MKRNDRVSLSGRKMRKDNICFIEANSSFSHTMLSYGYLRAFTEKMIPGWTWSHIETTVNDDDTDPLAKLLSIKPAIACATVYLFNHEYVIKLLKKFKSIQPSSHIFLGGPEFLGCNENFLRINPEISAVIRGDESSFHLLPSKLDTPDKWNQIPGLCFIRNNDYIDCGTAKISDKLDKIPSPYEKSYFTPGRPFYQLETSRGCHGKCSFCSSALSEGVTCFSLNRIKKDLVAMNKLGICEIRIVDRTFNENKERALELLGLFRKYGHIRFHLEINPALVDDGLINELKMVAHGKLHIEAGIQTLRQEALKSVGRLGSASKMLSGLKKLCSLENADIHTDLIAGLPGQKLKDVLEDVKTLISIGPGEIQLEILKILPGAPISAKIPAGLSHNPLPPYEVLKTSDMSFCELREAEKLSRLLDSFYNTPRLKNLFIYLFMHLENFIEDFYAFLESKNALGPKPHLETRFLLLHEFTAGKDSFLKEVASFFYLASAFPHEKISSVKIEKIKTTPELENMEVIMELEHAHDSGRFIKAEFNCNAAAIWKGSVKKPDRGRYEYLFKTAHGNRIQAIYRLHA